MKGIFVRILLAVLLMTALGGAKKKAAEPAPTGPMPWQLRDHYTFSNAPAVLFCFNDNAELRLQLPGNRWAMTDGHFEIVLGDGKTVKSTDFAKARVNREPFDGVYGKGTHYETIFPAKDGLAVVHRLSKFDNFSFFLLELELRNEGTTPISVSIVRPVVVRPGGIPDPEGKVQFRPRRMMARGGMPVYSADTCYGAAFRFPVDGINLTMDVLPFAPADASVSFESVNGAWQGAISCGYAPAHTIAPGEAFRVTPVFLAHGVATPSRADMYYAWSYTKCGQPARKEPLPRAWISASEGGSLDDITAAAAQLASAGVNYGLIPAGWEDRPGSLEGNGRFPKRPGNAASALESAGLKPGITIDPLGAAGMKSEFTVAGPNETAWLNVAAPGAREAAVARLQELIGDGFNFFVVAPSTIPDDVLTQLKRSRADADRVAFEIAREAAGEHLVLPSAAGSLDANLDKWLSAAAASSRMGEYNLNVGPVRLALDTLKNVDETLLAAMSLWSGPIELVGRPDGDAKQAIGRLISRGGHPARPLDLNAIAPKLWQIHTDAKEMGQVAEAVVAFPGAPAWSAADLDLDPGTAAGAHVFRASDGASVPLDKGPVPASDTLTVYGVGSTPDRPVFLGANGDLGLFLRDVANLAWDAQKGLLSGRLDRSFEGEATAYVLVPPGWTFKKGKAGGESIKRELQGDRIAFTLRSGAANFELEFARNQ